MLFNRMPARPRTYTCFITFGRMMRQFSSEFTTSCQALASRRTLCSDCHFFPRQREVERGAVVQFTFRLDRSAMRPHDVLGDRQSQPRAARLPRASLVHSVEALEQPWQVFAWDSRSKVAHIKLHAIFRFTRPDQDLAAGLAVLHGIIDQVAEHLVNSIPVHQN